MSPLVAKYCLGVLFFGIGIWVMPNAFAVDDKFLPRDNRTDLERRMDQAGQANSQRQQEIQRQQNQSRSFDKVDIPKSDPTNPSPHRIPDTTTAGPKKPF